MTLDVTWPTALAMNAEQRCMSDAVAQARRCVSEPGRISPSVGAVVVKEGAVLGAAFRGETRAGDHAEYILLERKLANIDLLGATLYTTLEPCTTRSVNKKPCCDRIIARGIGRVVIGTLDPDIRIRGIGVQRLQEAKVSVQLAHDEAVRELELLNAEFFRDRQSAARRASSLLDVEAHGPFHIRSRSIFESREGLPGYAIELGYPEIVTGLSEPTRAELNAALFNVALRPAAEVRRVLRQSDRPGTEEFYMSYCVELATKGVLSVSFPTYSMMANGLRPIHDIETHNFTFEPLTSLSIGDLFPGHHWPGRLSELAIQALLGKDGGSDYADEIKRGAGPKTQNFRHFTLSADGLELWFPLESIGPVSWGARSVDVAFADIADILDPALAASIWPRMGSLGEV